MSALPPKADMCSPMTEELENAQLGRVLSEIEA